MINSLLERKIDKRPDKVRLQGRILFLTEDPELAVRGVGPDQGVARVELDLRDRAVAVGRGRAHRVRRALPAGPHPGRPGDAAAPV